MTRSSTSDSQIGGSPDSPEPSTLWTLFRENYRVVLAVVVKLLRLTDATCPNYPMQGTPTIDRHYSVLDRVFHPLQALVELHLCGH